jgi:5'-methylthioadenosine phosphorylase
VDAGVDAETAVAQEEVFRVFAQNVERLRDLLFATVAALPAERTCRCARAHDGIALPITLPE